MNSILDDLTSYLQYRQEEAVTEVEVGPETMKALGNIEPGTAAPAALSPEPAPARTAPPADAAGLLAEAAKEIAACTKCGLHKTRTKTVPGQGASSPEIMFVGEGPGADEDRQGLAFVGRAGRQLTKMVEAMGFTREEVFIGNVVKCRPPENRVPLPDEMDTCLPYLKRQIAILKPKVIVALGATAVKALLETTTGITKLRGQWHTFEGIDLMPTFHPAYLLRNPAKKWETWEDLKEVLARLGRKPPPTKSKTG